jgi:hypothetical protein
MAASSNTDANRKLKDEWGCSLFVEDQKLVELSTTIAREDYVLQELAGGVAKIDQIQLCGSVRSF